MSTLTNPVSRGLFPMTLPPGADVPTISADLSDDGVSAPSTLVPPLAHEVFLARESGVNLSVVVLTRPERVHTELRDLATALSKSHDGTILVLSPTNAGSVSDTYPTYKLEYAINNSQQAFDIVNAPEPIPVIQTRAFARDMKIPEINWNMWFLTTATVAVVLVALGVWLFKKDTPN